MNVPHWMDSLRFTVFFMINPYITGTDHFWFDAVNLAWKMVSANNVWIPRCKYSSLEVKLFV